MAERRDDDLRRSIEEATGQNLEWFFDQWLMKGGYPEFEVAQSYDAAAKLLRLTVRQSQKVEQITPVFKTPVEIEVITKRPARVSRDDRSRRARFLFQCRKRPSRR